MSTRIFLSDSGVPFVVHACCSRYVFLRACRATTGFTPLSSGCCTGFLKRKKLLSTASRFVRPVCLSCPVVSNHHDVTCSYLLFTSLLYPLISALALVCMQFHFFLLFLNSFLKRHTPFRIVGQAVRVIFMLSVHCSTLSTSSDDDRREKEKSCSNSDRRDSSRREGLSSAGPGCGSLGVFFCSLTSPCYIAIFTSSRGRRGRLRRNGDGGDSFGEGVVLSGRTIFEPEYD
ncbi:hypothetical protein HDK64DRAFT_121508 [Phyllosticta capitalensis]